MSTIRIALLGLIASSFATASCARRADPAPLSPEAPPAIGSAWTQAPADAPDPPQASRPLLSADDVDGALDEQIGSGRVAVPYLSTDAWMGAEIPTVTMVAFIDYQCPYSRKLSATLYELVERYPDDLRVVLKHRPLEHHLNAKLAAEAAVLAQRHGRFWPMHDALFENQADLQREKLPAIAGRVGLSMPEVESGLDAHSAADAIARDLDLAAAIGVGATPTSFVNGRKLSGALPFTEIAAVVDEELALAAALQKAGAQRHELYARVLHAAAATPPHSPGRHEVPPGHPDPALSYAVPVAGRPVRGPADALVTVVMSGDFQCPFTRRATETMRALIDARPGAVRIVFRHNPLSFHPQARPAAKAAIAAGNQGKFWEMHDLVFEHQRELDDGLYRKLAKKLKLDLERFARDMKSEATEALIVEDVEVARRFGATATPVFFVNGRFISGAHPLEAFTRLVDAELPEARELRDREAPPDLYERLIRDFLPSVQAGGGG